MFGNAKQLGSTERSIPLATHKGTNIPNVVETSHLPHDALQKQRLLVQTQGQNWRERKPPTGIYNCAGMVWANRRTAIFEPLQYEIILEEDAYRQIGDQNSDLLPGDIVVYRFADTNEIVHVARVYNFEQAPGLPFTIPWTISKWNSVSGEYLHRYNDTPYQKMKNTEVVIQFYTDRPGEHGATNAPRISEITI